MQSQTTERNHRNNISSFSDLEALFFIRDQVGADTLRKSRYLIKSPEDIPLYFQAFNKINFLKGIEHHIPHYASIAGRRTGRIAAYSGCFLGGVFLLGMTNSPLFPLVFTFNAAWSFGMYKWISTSATRNIEERALRALDYLKDIQ